jgi:uncharacterized membrane protein
MPALRFFLLLSLIVWIGGIIFFAFVVAPTLFAVLPTHHLAGLVVNPSLNKLHWIGLGCGVAFLVCSTWHRAIADGRAQVLSGSNLTVLLMMLLTAISLFVVTPKMAALRNQIGVIDNVALTDPLRVQFNALHVWSTRLEVGVLLLGLGVVYAVSVRLRAE